MIPYFILFLVVTMAMYIIWGYNRPGIKNIAPLTAENRFILSEHVDFYRDLNEAGKKNFEQQVSVFLSYVNIESVGTEIQPLDRVLVASSAVIPIFGFGGWKYKNLTNVLIYPDTFNHDFEYEGGKRNILGMVGTGYMNGQMILPRAALLAGFSRNNGNQNAPLHEFVHLLDKSDGETDGIPENLMKHEYTVPWLKMIHEEMHQIKTGKSDINPYALTNEAEFFAVVSEYFFEKPTEFKKNHPELYISLAEVFLQDPAK